MVLGVRSELICERFSSGLAWKRGDPFLPPTSASTEPTETGRETDVQTLPSIGAFKLIPISELSAICSLLEIFPILSQMIYSARGGVVRRMTCAAGVRMQCGRPVPPRPCLGCFGLHRRAWAAADYQ